MHPPTLLYNGSKAVIPAKAGIQFKNTGFRVKPGMTNKGKRFLTHYTSLTFLTFLCYVLYDKILIAKETQE